MHRYASPSFQRVLGDHPEDLIGTTLFEHIHPDDRALVLERWQQLFTWGSMQATFRYSRADGAWRWLETSATHNLRSDEAAVVMVGRDRTEQRELEAHLLMMQKQESVGRLASGAAHEFNILLTGISAYVELAMRLLPADHEVRYDLEQIQQISAHAAALARQIGYRAWARRLLRYRKAAQWHYLGLQRATAWNDLHYLPAASHP